MVGDGQETLTYSVPVVLAGKIETRLFYGPPNYENDGISKEDLVYVLVLKNPVKVEGDAKSELNKDSFADVSVMQVDVRGWPKAKTFLKKNVVVTGVLSEAMIGHEHTKVIVRIDSIRLLNSR